ncbi:MAG TPA: aminoglycoside phosphotransferase family protein [Pyrinomonadaceae bacterium]
MPISLTIETATVSGAVADLTGAPARSVERLPASAVNRVYKVSTEAGGAFVVKVFRYADWPEEGKLSCVERKLTERGVPHPRLIHVSRDADLFPHGFSVTEHVEGHDCAAAIAGGDLSIADYCRGIGSLLRKVHAVGFDRFGHLANCEGTDEDFVEAKLAYEVNDRLGEIDAAALPPTDLAPRIEDKVRRLLAPFARRFAPVLVHSDAAPRNAILTDAGEFVLADWDEALASIALEDYAKLTYLLFHAHDAPRLDAEARGVVRGSFFEGYGETGFDADETRAIEDALHTIQAADYLSYQFKTGNAAAFETTKELLLSLL